MSDCRGCERKEEEIIRLEEASDRARRAHSKFRRQVEERDEYTDSDVLELKRRVDTAETRAAGLRRRNDVLGQEIEKFRTNEQRNVAAEIERKRIVTEIRDRSVAIDQEMDEMRQHLETLEPVLVDWHGMGQRCKHILLRWTADHNSESRDVMVRATADLVDELDALEERL